MTNNEENKKDNIMDKNDSNNFEEKELNNKSDILSSINEDIKESLEINEKSEVNDLEKSNNEEIKEDQKSNIHLNENNKENSENLESNNNNHFNTINYQMNTIETDNSTKDQILSNFNIYKNTLITMSLPQIRNNRYNSMKTFEYTFKNKLIENKRKKLAINNIEEDNDIRKLKQPVELTFEEKKNYLDLYQTEEVDDGLNNLAKSKNNKNLYKSEFEKTKYADEKSFKIFYNKLHKEEEIFRKGGSIETPSFNLIRATKKYRIPPNPIGVVKKKGLNSILNLKNKSIGDNYARCLTESFDVSEHLTEINLSKNRLSDLGIIPLLKSILNNRILSPKIKLLNLSYNKLGFAASELISQMISNINCNLQHINLESNHLGNDNIKKIVDAIIKNLFPKLKYINLALNNLDDNIALNISQLVSKCEILTVLILYQNQLGNKGAGLIMSEIKKHNRIKILDLSWNLIGNNLTDELPNLEELTSAVKDKENHFDNAYLNELKISMQFRNQSLSPIKTNNKVSYFTNELCELFHNKNTELLHLDISYNNINYIDSKAISENIKDNHTILGIHVDGNNMWVDELGFVYPIEKNKYEKDHFANSQLYYRISEEHPLIKSNILNIKKLRAKNNCWICEGWREVKFNYKPNSNNNNKQAENLNDSTATLHLNFEKYKSYDMRLFHYNFQCYRMCPPGPLYFFIAINGIPVDNYGPITSQIKDAIIYTQDKKPKEFIDDESDEEEESEEQKQFIITKLAKTEVKINPEVITIDDGNYLKMISHCQPRPEKKLNLKKRPKTPWSFPISIWAWYGYDYNGETESTYNNAFEFDYERCKFSKDKDLVDSQDEENLKNILKTNYKQIIEAYKNMSAYLGWKIWQIGQNQITEFAQSCPGLVDSKYLINDVLVKVTEVKSNVVDKQEKKQNKNIPDNIIRHQFLMLLVKIAKDKYFRTKELPTVSQSVEYAFENHYNKYINNFDNHKWRIERYYNEEVDNILKAYIPVFDALFYTYAPQQIMSRKDSFWMQLENFTNLCNVLMDNDFPVKEISIIFSLSMRLQVNEIDSNKHYNMVLPEFLEAFCRFIDKLSPIPYGEDASKWDMQRRQAQPLDAKLETILPRIIKMIDGPKKYVKEKFTAPLRDEDYGFYIINYDNPLYEGLLPPKPKRKRRASQISNLGL